MISSVASSNHSSALSLSNFIANHQWKILAVDTAAIAAAVAIGIAVLSTNPAGWAIAAVAVLGLVAIGTSAALLHNVAKRPMPILTPPNPTLTQKIKDFFHAHKTKMLLGAGAAFLVKHLLTRPTHQDPIPPVPPSFFTPGWIGLGLVAAGCAIHLYNKIQKSNVSSAKKPSQLLQWEQPFNNPNQLGTSNTSNNNNFNPSDPNQTDPDKNRRTAKNQQTGGGSNTPFIPVYD